MKRAGLLILGIVLASCDGGGAAEPPPPATPRLGETVMVVPSPGIDPAVELQDAANNLDVVLHDGSVFLAFRTAPNHFASPQARIWVLRSDDGGASWHHEADFHMDTDLREPRLLSWDGRLFLYFAVLGKDVFDFEPQGMRMSERTGPGAWTPDDWAYLEGFIPWRTRTIDGIPYLIGYVGGAAIYDGEGEGDAAMEVHWLTTADGALWTPVIPGQPAVLQGGGSETDFAFLDDGTLVAVVRNEEGDADGFGSKICRAEADAPGDWTCAADPRKYDSPLVFAHGGEIWLIGRRNVTDTGWFDLGDEDLIHDEAFLQYSLDYWERPKRCALWRVDPDALAVEFVLDLPSRGDTCFPSVIPTGDDAYHVYNYSSPLDGPDVGWLLGQGGVTNIYRTELRFGVD